MKLKYKCNKGHICRVSVSFQWDKVFCEYEIKNYGTCGKPAKRVPNPKQKHKLTYAYI